MNEDKLYQHNENINYLLSRKLSFVLRYGMSFLFFIGIIVLVGLYFIKTPDVLEGKFTLTSSSPPKALVAKLNGRIIKKNIHDQSTVKKGEILLVLESVADLTEVEALESKLNTIQTLLDSNLVDSIPFIHPLSFQNLGEVQQSFEQFKRSSNELYQAISDGQYRREKDIILKRKSNLLLTRQNLWQQKLIYEREYDLANESWESDSLLNQQRSITKTELRSAESTRLQRKLNINNLQQNLINNENTLNDIEQQLLVLEKSILQQQQNYLQSFALLRSTIQDWKSKFLFIAPFNGIVSFHKNLYEGIQIQAGEPILYLISDSTNWICEVLIPQQNFGKITLNQTSILKFDGYNFEEYGVIKGFVKSISATPQEIKTNDGLLNLYLVQIGLNNNMKTTYHKPIQPRYGLTGTATITLDNKSVLEKLFLDKFKALFVFQ